MRRICGAVVGALSVCCGLLVPASGQSCVAVTTYHNDNLRTAQNLAETVLTPTNLGSVTELFATHPLLDGWSVAQPLYLPQTTIDGAVHNVVFMATLANSMYAFDADTGVLYWHVTYGPPDPVPFQNGYCTDTGFAQNPSHGAGIVGTPAIDMSISPPAIYFVTKEFDGTTHSLKVHAVDSSSGNELSGSPAVMQGSVVNHAGTTINFSAEFQMSPAGDAAFEWNHLCGHWIGGMQGVSELRLGDVVYVFSGEWICAAGGV